LSFIEDSAVPVEFLPEYIDQVLKICAKYETEVSMYAHASVGVIHVQPMLDLRQEEDIERLKRITDETFALVVKYGGAWSGEHGDGLVRSPYNEKFFGPQLYDALRQVKRLFDPNNIMNPGKIVDAVPMDQNLRYGTSYRDQDVKTQFRYRQEGSFRELVHMCTGVGECRKTLGGTMCPSYRATRDEEHSTRGRANALRMAMSGQLNSGGLTSKRLHEVLDLCLSCKACKSECPSNVDMAKMKSDVLQMYYDKHGTSLRDRLIRDSSTMAARFSGAMAGIVNAVQRTKLFRAIVERLAGFDARRILPEYAPEPFYKWFEKHKGGKSASGKKVVLFADTYLNFHEPSIGISAVQLLEGCGYEVILANVGCCQRPRISHGFLREAKKDGTLTALGFKYDVDQETTGVACESSGNCAVRDDLPDLVEDESLAASVRDRVMPVDVFLAKEFVAGHIDATLVAVADHLMVHGHCHQKALHSTTPMKAVLSKTSATVSEIPSGCCGMAGSFGYEREHYALSEKIGEMVLFPSVRSRKEGTVVVANGFSCRHQIEHFTGVKPRHWVEVVRTTSASSQ